MAQTTSKRDKTPWPQVDVGEIVFLLDARDGFEAELLSAWIDETRADGESQPTHSVISLTDSSAGRTLAEKLDDDATWMQPLRIAWLPKSRKDGEQSVKNTLFGQLLKPGPLRRRWLARHQRERVAMVVGDGAYLGDLRERFAGNVSTPASRDTLADFVSAQALIALERSERNIRGARYKVPRTLPSDVFADAAFQQALANNAQQRDQPLADVRAQAARYLEEMAAAQDPFTLEMTNALYRTAARSHHDSEIDVLEEQVEQVADALQSRPVIFLISHKSMLDTAALSFVLFDRNLPTRWSPED